MNYLQRKDSSSGKENRTSLVVLYYDMCTKLLGEGEREGERERRRERGRETHFKPCRTRERGEKERDALQTMPHVELFSWIDQTTRNKHYSSGIITFMHPQRLCC